MFVLSSYPNLKPRSSDWPFVLIEYEVVGPIASDEKYNSDSNSSMCWKMVAAVGINCFLMGLVVALTGPGDVDDVINYITLHHTNLHRYMGKILQLQLLTVTIFEYI